MLKSYIKHEWEMDSIYIARCQALRALCWTCRVDTLTFTELFISVHFVITLNTEHIGENMGSGVLHKDTSICGVERLEGMT